MKKSIKEKVEEKITAVTRLNVKERKGDFFFPCVEKE